MIKKMNSKNIPFHPYLFALLPFLMFFIVNRTQLDFIELFQPYLLILVPTILLGIGFTFFFRSSKKSGLLVSLIVLAFFSYGYIFISTNAMIASTFNFEIPDWIFLIPFLIIPILGFVYCLKTKQKLNNITTILNVISITLIAVTSIQLMTYDYNSQYVFEDDIDISTKFYLTDSLEKYPDIYLIILDSYAGSQVLDDTFDYNNDKFIYFLNTNGFHTPENTQSNYPQSFISISSSKTYCEL